MCAESPLFAPLFDVLPTDNCGGGGGDDDDDDDGCCVNDDDRINSMGTPVYGDFTTSSYFGGKSFAAVNFTKQKTKMLTTISFAWCKKMKRKINKTVDHLLAPAAHEYIPVAVVSTSYCMQSLQMNSYAMDSIVVATYKHGIAELLKEKRKKTFKFSSGGKLLNKNGVKCPS